MASSYKDVAATIRETLKTIIAQRAGVEPASIDIQVSPSTDGEEFEKGWTFTLNDMRENVRLCMALTMGMLLGRNSDKTVDLTALKITDRLGSIGYKLNEILKSAGLESIDYRVDDTLSEVRAAVAKEKAVLDKAFFILKAESPIAAASIERVTESVRQQVKEAMIILQQDNPRDGNRERVAKLAAVMDQSFSWADNAATALGLHNTSHFSQNISRAQGAQWTDEGKPLSSSLAIYGLEGDDANDSLIQDAFDNLIRNTLLRYTMDKGADLQKYKCLSGLEDAYTAALKARGDNRFSDATICEAAKKIVFCAHHVIRKALTTDIVNDVKARIEQVPVEVIAGAAKLDNINLPQSVSRAAFNAAALQIIPGVREAILMEALPWRELEEQSYTQHKIPRKLLIKPSVECQYYILSELGESNFRDKFNRNEQMKEQTVSAIKHAIRQLYPSVT